MQGIDRLDRNLSSRRLLAEYLFERIEAGTQMIHCHRSALDSVFWRANILVPATRNLVLHALLKEKCKVSSWFPPAHEFLEQEWLGVTPIADQVGREILNVWVNDEADTSYIAAIAENICVMTASKHHESRQPTASSP